VKQAEPQAILSSSGLPRPSLERLRAGPTDYPEDLQKPIETSGSTWPNSPNLRLSTSADGPRVCPNFSPAKLYSEAIGNGGRAPPYPNPSSRWHRPLSGIRENVPHPSGTTNDRALSVGAGVSRQRPQLHYGQACVADALNKVLIKEFAEYPRWWDRLLIFRILPPSRPFADVLGRLGELPTVAEVLLTPNSLGRSNRELDLRKKGGYLGHPGSDRTKTRPTSFGPLKLWGRPPG